MPTNAQTHNKVRSSEISASLQASEEGEYNSTDITGLLDLYEH